MLCLSGFELFSRCVPLTNVNASERFGEHRRSISNHQQLSGPTPVSLHFNQAGVQSTTSF